MTFTPLHGFPHHIPRGLTGRYPITGADGSTGYLVFDNGQLHSLTEPSYVFGGEESWLKYGAYHRDGGLPARIINNSVYKNHTEHWENGRVVRIANNHGITNYMWDVDKKFIIGTYQNDDLGTMVATEQSFEVK